MNYTEQIIDGYNRTIPINIDINDYGMKTYDLNMQHILPDLQWQYLVVLFLAAAYLLFYVLFNFFVEESEKKRNICKNLDLWAIIPIVYISVMVVTMVTRFKGV